MNVYVEGASASEDPRNVTFHPWPCGMYLSG